MPSPALPSRALPSPTPKRRGFTLIELLVVIAIVSVLAAILFPVFQSVRENARAAACLSNEKQIGLAVAQYLQDSDETLYPFVTFDSSALPTVTAQEDSRLGVSDLDPAAAYPLLWYNALQPYARSVAILACPDDAQPTLSPDASGTMAGGRFTVPRSYVANRSAEGLSLSQVDDPVETMVVTEKRTDADEASEGGDLWLESFKGDFNTDPAQPEQMMVASDRHRGGINCVFFDGHAKRYTPALIRASKDLTGCTLVQAYPHLSSPPAGDDACDTNDAGCVNNSSGTAGKANVCNTFP